MAKFRLEIKKEVATAGFHDDYRTTNYYIYDHEDNLICKFYEDYGGIADIVLSILNEAF